MPYFRDKKKGRTLDQRTQLLIPQFGLILEMKARGTKIFIEPALQYMTANTIQSSKKSQRKPNVKDDILFEILT